MLVTDINTVLLTGVLDQEAGCLERRIQITYFFTYLFYKKHFEKATVLAFLAARQFWLQAQAAGKLNRFQK